MVVESPPCNKLSKEQMMTSPTISHAIEIVKAAIPSQSGVWINNPKAVAEFIEIVATKIDELHKKQ